jgi:hypothetical protein
VAEGGPLGPRTRTAPAAFGRGVSQVAANPGLLLAPLAFGGTFAALCVAAGFAFAWGTASFLFGRSAAFSRTIPGLVEALGDVRDRVLDAPLGILAGLVALLAALLVLTALAAWIRAGVTGCLVEADARAAEGAPLVAFRHPAPGAAFFTWAGRRFGPFFALVNLYGVAGSVLVLLAAVPFVGVVAGAIGRNTVLLVLSGLALAVAVPVVIVGGAAVRVVYLVAGRVLVTEPLDALAAVGRAIALVRGAAARTAVLYLLCAAGGMAVGLGFVVPRMVLTFVAGWVHAGFGAIFAVSGVFLVLQLGAGLAYDLAVTGSFVALWPAEGTSTQEPPVP